MLESGRNSLLESAQQATLISVATAALDRQCNKLAQAALSTKIHTRREQKQWSCGQPGAPPSRRLCFCRYSIFDSGAYRIHAQSGFSVKKKPPSTHS
jgi:hypothetical protein